MSVSRMGLGVALLAGLAVAAHAATPAPVLDRMSARWKGVNDYEIVVRSTEWEGGKEKVNHYRYVFKKPAMVRLQTLSGPDRGGELVVRPDGVIRGRKNAGLLKVFAVTLKRADPRLRGGDGVPVWDLNYGSEIARLRAAVQAPGVQASASGPSGGSYVLTLRYTRGAAAGSVDTYWVDSATDWIVKRERSRNGALLERDLYTGLKINPGFTDKYFEF